MQYWRLLEYSLRSPAMNLAVEEAILRCLLEYDGVNTLRIWRNPPSVIIGYFQNLWDCVNVEACKKLRIPIIRRISGGGAVYHDYGNLNYSLFINRESLNPHLKTYAEDVEKSYMLFCNGVVEGLKELGIETYIQKGNIMVYGKKVSGSAQHRLYHLILHHGTLMVNVNLKNLGQALKIHNPKEFLINLYDALPNKIPLTIIKKSIEKGFEKVFSINFKRGALTFKEKHIAKKLYEMKYSQRDWNMNLL